MAVEKDPSLWSVDEVFGFLWNQGFLEEAEKCRDQLIDGQAFLLLKVEHIYTFLDVKFGPALKISHTIETLKLQSKSARWEYQNLDLQFRNPATSNRDEAIDVYMFDDDQENPEQHQNPGLTCHRVSNPNPQNQVSFKKPEISSRKVSKRNRLPGNPELTGNQESDKFPNHHSGGNKNEISQNVMSERDFEMNLEAFKNDLQSLSGESESSSGVVRENRKDNEAVTREDKSELSDNQVGDNVSDSEDSPLPEKYYRVEKILDKQIMPDGQVNYLVKWIGFSDQDNSWESKKNLHCRKLIKQFEAEHHGSVLYIAEKILKLRLSGRGEREYLVKWQGYDVAESTWEPLENLLGNETLYEFERNVLEMTKLVNKCSLCDQRIDSLQQLSRHFLVAHPGGNPPKAKCLICNRNNSNLRKHLLDSHNVQISGKKNEEQ